MGPELLRLARARRRLGSALRKTEILLMPHTCHAVECTRPVPPRKLFCAIHWPMLPAELKAAVWAAYRPGQEKARRPSAAYMAAALAAKAHVAEVEGLTKPASFLRRLAGLWEKRAVGT